MCRFCTRVRHTKSQRLLHGWTHQRMALQLCFIYCVLCNEWLTGCLLLPTDWGQAHLWMSRLPTQVVISAKKGGSTKDSSQRQHGNYRCSIVYREHSIIHRQRRQCIQAGMGLQFRPNNATQGASHKSCSMHQSNMRLRPTGATRAVDSVLDLHEHVTSSSRRCSQSIVMHVLGR